MKLNQVICGDCLEVFKDIPDESFDMTFADPPFNLSKKYSSYKDSMNEDEYTFWCEKWISEMVRVTKPSGSIFLHNIPKWLVQYNCILNDHDVKFKHWISWEAPTSPMGKSLQPAHYGILFYVKDSVKSKIYELRMPHKRCRSCNFLLKDYGGKKNQIHPFGPLISDVWTDIHRCKHNKYKDNHPCQLPIHLLERLILLCTDEGDAVFDCFMGTGTTAIAAKRLGRKYLGIELAPDYIAICENKLSQEKIESKLDSIWVSCYLKDVATVRNCDLWNKEMKMFKPEWIELFDTWPFSDDERRLLNVSSLKFCESVQKTIVSLSK